MNINKIYDCFNFFNELDILELRLNILYEVVDYFVIIESSVKHSGEKKEFIFEKNKHRFKKFEDKIIHYKIFDTPDDFTNLHKSNDKILEQIYFFINVQTNRFNKYTQPDYGRDFFQKESVRRAISNCDDNDIIMFSDADEIPNPNILINLKQFDIDNYIYSLNQPMFCYFLNVLKDSNWYGTKLSKYKNIKNISLNEIRNDESLSIKVPNGGWHFSFMGGPEMVKNKILSYSARDMSNDYILNSIEHNINNDIDPFFRSKLKKIEIDNTYPEYILHNLDKYKKMIKDFDKLNF
jgi:beta-1,4-mannosyl-glycoprotein beta-1,4-N-acetylglucosaminyltransferase